MTVREFRRVGPGGEGIGDLPPGTGAAIGSESCVHLLPGGAALGDAIAACAARGVRLVLLTPYLRDADLRTLVALLRTVPRGADMDVAVNDWGAAHVLRTLFPALRLSLGRLLAGQKRCPRIAVSERLTPRGREWHGIGLFASASSRSRLRDALGIRGYHLDAVDWSVPAVADLLAAEPDAGSGEPLDVYLHLPWAVVTVSDACPWIGGVSSARVASCPRPCREGFVELREPSMGGVLVQRGKERLCRAGGEIPRALRATVSTGAALAVVRSAGVPPG